MSYIIHTLVLTRVNSFW